MAPSMGIISHFFNTHNYLCGSQLSGRSLGIPALKKDDIQIPCDATGFHSDLFYSLEKFASLSLKDFCLLGCQKIAGMVQIHDRVGDCTLGKT